MSTVKPSPYLASIAAMPVRNTSGTGRNGKESGGEDEAKAKSGKSAPKSKKRAKPDDRAAGKPAKKAKTTDKATKTPKPKKDPPPVPPLPLDYDTASTCDRALWDLKEQGEKFDVIMKKWNELGGACSSQKFLRERYAKLKENFSRLPRGHDAKILLAAEKEILDNFEAQKWSMIAAAVVNKGGPRYSNVGIKMMVTNVKNQDSPSKKKVARTTAKIFDKTAPQDSEDSNVENPSVPEKTQKAENLVGDADISTEQGNNSVTNDTVHDGDVEDNDTSNMNDGLEPGLMNDSEIRGALDVISAFNQENLINGHSSGNLTNGGMNGLLDTDELHNFEDEDTDIF